MGLRISDFNEFVRSIELNVETLKLNYISLKFSIRFFLKIEKNFELNI